MSVKHMWQPIWQIESVAKRAVICPSSQATELDFDQNETLRVETEQQLLGTSKGQWLREKAGKT